MPQWKAFTLGLLLTISTLGALVGGQFGLALVFFAPALCFWGLWYYRHQRDRRTVKHAAQRQRQLADQPAQMLPPIVSKGSTNSLFVPPPLY